MTFVDSRLLLSNFDVFNLDSWLFNSRLFTLDFLLSTFLLSTFLLSTFYSQLSTFYSQLSTFTLDSRALTFRYTRACCDFEIFSALRNNHFAILYKVHAARREGCRI